MDLQKFGVSHLISNKATFELTAADSFLYSSLTWYLRFWSRGMRGGDDRDDYHGYEFEVFVMLMWNFHMWTTDIITQVSDAMLLP